MENQWEIFYLEKQISVRIIFKNCLNKDLSRFCVVDKISLCVRIKLEETILIFSSKFFSHYVFLQMKRFNDGKRRKKYQIIIKRLITEKVFFSCANRYLRCSAVFLLLSRSQIKKSNIFDFYYPRIEKLCRNWGFQIRYFLIFEESSLAPPRDRGSKNCAEIRILTGQKHMEQHQKIKKY